MKYEQQRTETESGVVRTKVDSYETERGAFLFSFSFFWGGGTLRFGERFVLGMRFERKFFTAGD